MTASREQPLVSVVTPVYNGATYLRECIDSVLGQTYQNWEYVILDNASTDDTPDIVREYAAREPRIRHLRNDTLLPQIQNWNVAMAGIAPQSQYCKVIHADDVLMPECLERMVDVAEKYPSVAIVGAYRIDGRQVNMASIPFPVDMVDGRELARKRLLGEWADLFGSPSSIMYRSSCVHERGDTFYGLDNPNADTELCFELLKRGDYGFVHQVLSYTRRHEATESVNARLQGIHSLGRIMIARDHGADFLTPPEHRFAMELQLKYHYTFLADNVGRFLERDFRRRTFDLFASCGSRVRWTRLLLVYLRRRLNLWLGGRSAAARQAAAAGRP